LLTENKNSFLAEPDVVTKGGFRKWLLIFGGWMLAAILLASHQTLSNSFSEHPDSAWSFYLVQTVSAFFWFLLTPIILWITARFTPEQSDLFRKSLIFFGLSLLVIFASLAFDSLIFLKLVLPPNQQNLSFFAAFKLQFLRNFPWKVLTYGTVLGIVYGVGYYRKFRERELRAVQLEARLAQVRFQVLKMQIHPHFLFNTHNAISELIYKDPPAAERMLSNLSDLLRLSLEKLEIEEVSLQQELEFLKKYLEIEHTRFQDRLRIEMKIAPDTLDAAVPNLILLPLVENAVKHGIAPLARGGTIKITSANENGKLHLQVTDNGVGIASGDEKQIIKGIGLANTKARLQHLYGKEQSFTIRSADKNGFSVILEIPFKRATKLKQNFSLSRKKNYEDTRPSS